MVDMALLSIFASFVRMAPVPFALVVLPMMPLAFLMIVAFTMVPLAVMVVVMRRMVMPLTPLQLARQEQTDALGAIHTALSTNGLYEITVIHNLHQVTFIFIYKEGYRIPLSHNGDASAKCIKRACCNAMQGFLALFTVTLHCIFTVADQQLECCGITHQQ